MAIGGRNTNRFNANIWPGFVDAMTGLLLVLMFVLTIFMVIQFVLSQEIHGQEDQLNELTAEVASLADALGLEQARSSQLAGQVGQLTTDLSGATDELSARGELIARLTAERDAANIALAEANNRITGFEAQVAGLLADRTDLRDQVAGLEQTNADMMTEQEALNLALAQARTEIDTAAEEARLAAARREAFEALIAELQAKGATDAATIAELEQGGATTAAQVTELEAARLADAAALAALRERLSEADAEITAMTLALEQQRKEAEDTLTLLAAANAAKAGLDAQLADAILAQQALQQDLDALAQARTLVETDRASVEDRLAAALAAAAAAEADRDTQMTEVERQAALLSAANLALANEQALSAESQREVAALNANVAELRAQVGQLQELVNIAAANDDQAQVQITNLSGQLNQALARAAAENARRLALEEAERARLEAETKELANYRSEFFGQLRQVLAGQDGVRIEGDRFVFSSEVLFAQGAADLSPLGMQEVGKVAAILRTVSAEIPSNIDWIIRVDGHTDNIPLSGTGEFKDNWELSQARALSVVRYMVEQEGIDARRLSANGFGEFQPVNTADTEEARDQNRRIELKLTER